MRLIIGTGNPGPEYENTRHNIGWMFLGYLAKKADFGEFVLEKKYNAEVSKGKVSHSKKLVPTLLVKPQTFVNVIGPLVNKIKTQLKIRPENIVIVQDDLDIPFGSCKLSFDKSSGGHRGIESVIKALKTQKFWRLRLGTAVPALKKARQQSDKRRDAFVSDFVLSKFSKKEHETLEQIFAEAYRRLTQ